MNDKILKFPGSRGAQSAPEPTDVPADEKTGIFLKDQHGNAVQISEDQQKALNCIASGMPFVFIGIAPTPSGADFYRALHGDDADLRNALDQIHTQVDKAYARRGLL